MNEDLLKTIKDTVEEAVNKQINGKLISIKDHLNRQDTTLLEVRDLLEERKFLMDLWKVVKFFGGVLVSIGGAILLYKNIR